VKRVDRVKLGVSGSGGRLGGAVLKRLKELPGDHEVVAISRSPEAARYADEARLGNYDNPAQLQDAYSALDRLLIIPSLDVGYGVRARQLVGAIDAATNAGVGHIVLISDVGTREECEPSVWAASWVGEQYLIRSAKTWTILRANYFMESYAQEAIMWSAVGRLAEVGEGRVAFVSRDDVAAAAAGILVGEGHAGAIYNATGPAALSVAERAELISRTGGRPIEVVYAPEEGVRQELRNAGFPEKYLDIVLDTKRRSADSGFDIVTGDVLRLSGRRPITIDQVLIHSFAKIPVLSGSGPVQ
jgi:NAD(P)H dehydrogenase (quinone)